MAKMYTLFLLGTATDFTPNPKPEANYPHGETLSIVAKAIIGSHDRIESDAHSYQTEHCGVVNGVNLKGTERYQRCELAVKLMLNAVSDGAEIINLVGHSRGAVQAIVAANQIAALVNSIDALRAMNNENNFANIEDLHEKLGQLKINIFSLDPVPGGSVLALGYLNFAWRSTEAHNFYDVPESVAHYVQCTYLDERSRGFKAIKPKREKETTVFEHYSLPGHHGTGSGNCGNHQGGNTVALDGVDIEIKPEITALVQQLLIVLLVEFLVDKQVTFESRERLEGSPFCDLICDAIDVSKRTERLLFLYEEIRKNYAHFERLRYSSYPTGLEHSVEEACHTVMTYVFGREVYGVQSEKRSRLVHWEDGKTEGTFIHKKLPNNPALYVNLAHLRLLVSVEMNVEFNGKPEDQVLRELSQLVCDPSGILSETGSLYYTACQSESSRAWHSKFLRIFCEAVALQLEAVANAYLHDHLHLAEKAQLRDAIIDFFALLSGIGSNPGSSGAKKVKIERIKVLAECRLTSSLQTRVESVSRHLSLFFDVESQGLKNGTMSMLDTLKRELRAKKIWSLLKVPERLTISGITPDNINILTIAEVMRVCLGLPKAPALTCSEDLSKSVYGLSTALTSFRLDGASFQEFKAEVSQVIKDIDALVRKIHGLIDAVNMFHADPNFHRREQYSELETTLLGQRERVVTLGAAYYALASATNSMQSFDDLAFHDSAVARAESKGWVRAGIEMTQSLAQREAKAYLAMLAQNRGIPLHNWTDVLLKQELINIIVTALSECAKASMQQSKRRGVTHSIVKEYTAFHGCIGPIEDLSEIWRYLSHFFNRVKVTGVASRNRDQVLTAYLLMSFSVHAKEERGVGVTFQVALVEFLMRLEVPRDTANLLFYKNVAAGSFFGRSHDEIEDAQKDFIRSLSDMSNTIGTRAY